MKAVAFLLIAIAASVVVTRPTETTVEKLIRALAASESRKSHEETALEALQKALRQPDSEAAELKKGLENLIQILNLDAKRVIIESEESVKGIKQNEQRLVDLLQLLDQDERRDAERKAEEGLLLNLVSDSTKIDRNELTRAVDKLKTEQARIRSSVTKEAEESAANLRLKKLVKLTDALLSKL